MPAKSRANREFNQFAGEGRKYAPKDKPREMRKPEEFPEPQTPEEPDTYVESSPYIGGNRVVKTRTL
jgi:hypothetical protein